MKQWQAIGAEVIIQPAQDPIQAVSCALVQTQNQLPIELVAPLDSENSPLTSRLKRGGGLDHICVFVDDLNTSMDAYKKQGAFVLVEPVFGCVWNRSICFLLQPTGLVLELMSREIVMQDKPDPLADAEYYQKLLSQ